MKSKLYIPCLFLLFVCSGCWSHRYLIVQREMLTKERLASSFVSSPDPLQVDKFKSQNLYVFYDVPKKESIKDMYLVVKIMRKDLEVDEVRIPIQSHVGHYEYSITPQEFKETGGLFSYHVSLINGQQKVVDSVIQQMWIDLPNRVSGLLY